MSYTYRSIKDDHVRYWLLSLAVTVVGCSNAGRTCGGKFEILWPDARGAYAPRVVATPTLPDGRVLNGPAATIYFKGLITDNGFAGKPAEPHIVSSGDVCVPTDAGSQVAVSAYAQYERLKQFDEKLGVAAQVRWPRKVSVETQMMGDPRDTLNNAHYVGENDITTLVPTTYPGVPTAMNVGIVAHEHFHAHFQAQVLNLLRTLASAATPGFEPRLPLRDSVDDVTRTNETVLRGWNEGLADFYATVYTGNPRFLTASIFDSREIEARALDSGLFLVGGEDLKPYLDYLRLPQFAAKAADNLIGIAYHQGTALARVLYRVTLAQKDPEVVLRKVMRELGDLPARLRGSSRLEFGQILPILLQDVQIPPGLCDAIYDHVAVKANFQRITSCASSSSRF